MKILFAVGIALSVATSGHSQSNPLEIRLWTTAIKTSLTPEHAIFFGYGAGNVLIPGDVPGMWGDVNPLADDSDRSSTVESINFFNRDTGFISGFIQDGSTRTDSYYRTTDGGRHWVKRHFPDDGWADNAVHLNNGKAWVAIAGSGHIDYSEDYGLTWRQIVVPHERERYADIFFNNQGEGLIGSLWNVIAYTADNGIAWKDIPTPLAQRAYRKTDIDSRPEINKVAIFSYYLIVQQEGQVFVTRKEDIHWRPIAYADFIADNNSNTLFFIRRNEVIRADSNVAPAAKYTVIDNIATGRYNNGVLVLWGTGGLTKLDDQGKVRHIPLYTTDTSMVNPIEIGESSEGTIGLIGNKLFIQRENSGSWKYKDTLRFCLAGRHVEMGIGDSLLVTGPGNSLLIDDLRTGQLHHTSVRTELHKACSSPVVKIDFELGSRGCFHYYADAATYVREGNAFVFKDTTSKGVGHKQEIQGYPASFPAEVVDVFMQKLPSEAAVPPTIATMGITHKDYDQCRRDIRAFQAYVNAGKPDHGIGERGFRMAANNIDFDRLIALTDSIGSVPGAAIDSLLYRVSDIGSTTTNWTAVYLTLANGKRISIKNNFYLPNSLHLPWTIDTDGWMGQKNVLAVNRLIESVYPGFLGRQGHADIVEAMVKYLYEHERSNSIN